MFSFRLIRSSFPEGKRCKCAAQKRIVRKGAAIVELAVLLPLLVFLFVIGVDFARVFYHLVAITNSAESGALDASRDVVYAANTEGIKNAVLADAKDLTPAPTVTSTTGVDELGSPCVKVTVTWKFSTITRFPGIPNTINLLCTVQMRHCPQFTKREYLIPVLPIWRRQARVLAGNRPGPECFSDQTFFQSDQRSQS